MALKRLKLLENLEERKILVDILVKKGNREVILQRKETENKEESRFMILEETYLLLKWKVKEANKILEKRYKCLSREIEKKHRIKMKMIEDHYYRVVATNERSNHAIIESNVKDSQNGERSLKHQVEELQNLNKESHKEIIKAIEDANAKLVIKIRK